ncbi:hypothetical protein IB642_03015 [Allofrancisella guangzhouensis]|uniref:Uncharacterized protein n=1 Tax=Allofrancisella guangzhouensis TaxID=594679 RepID=A0A0A8EBG0_9GAMM|nr:hypothetical protein [Allofrancisella guangzhouensis]AJC49486.1 hypothetical protein SD28_07625 [Allofrancisella guangzhouensis]MBK2027974.1 hypothetical protein [Allofrancisella guangzhouensis]MBK2043988.1 hypothetical protein [Allofrancisella guangzhouensis]MBK2045896.1 hypothetical protein [Allofrancisella guangzhouensis]
MKVLYLFFRGTGDPRSVIKARKEFCRNNPSAKVMPNDVGVPIYDSWCNTDKLNIDLQSKVLIESIDIPGPGTSGNPLDKTWDFIFCNMEKEARNVFNNFYIAKNGIIVYEGCEYDYVITAGFSRGAIIALYCATMFSKRGVKASCIMIDPVPGNARNHVFSEVEKANNFFKTGQIDFVVSLLNKEPPSTALKDFFKRVSFELPKCTTYDQVITIDTGHTCRYSEKIAQHYFLYIVIKYALGESFDAKKYKKYLVDHLTVNDYLVEGFNFNKKTSGFLNYVCSQGPRHIRSLKSGKYVENIPPYLARFLPGVNEEDNLNPINKGRSISSFSTNNNQAKTRNFTYFGEEVDRPSTFMPTRAVVAQQNIITPPDINSIFGNKKRSVQPISIQFNTQATISPRETQLNIEPKRAVAVFQGKKRSIQKPMPTLLKKW